MGKETIGIKIWLLVAGLVLWTVVQSCEMKEATSNENVKPVGHYEENEYNSDFSDFARVVSEALKSDKDFRYMVRDEALQLIDGDYDVLLRHFADKQVKARSSLKSEIRDYTVKELLEDSYMVGGINNTKSSVSIIDDLLRKYPDMQIAIPVHAEEWNVNNYIPTVTFLPLEYDDASTKTLTGYDSKGNIVSIDAINEPDEPVIVISENERMIIDPDPDNPVKPSAPTNLIGTQTESGIRLTWTMPAGTDPSNTSGYYIYRKTTESPAYSLTQNVYGAYNRSYDDNNVEASRSYSYYVAAYYQGLTSDPSNYISITAPNYPKPPTSFDAIQQTRNEIELRWENDHTQYIQETRLSKYVVGVTPGYQFYKTFSPNDHSYIDTEVIAGKKVNYKINHVTSFGESNAKYDFVIAPYRDISQESPVFIKQIKFTDWELERWPAGRPEFYICVTNVDAGGKTPYTVQEQIDCQFANKTNLSQVFYGKQVLKWKPGFWFDMLTFTIIEYDKPSGKLTFTTSVGYNLKDKDKQGLQASRAVDYEITFEDKGEKCGNSYLNYFDQPEQWLIFPNYGVQMLVSESDN